MKGWENLNEVDGHMRLSKEHVSFKLVSGAGGIAEMRFIQHLEVGHQGEGQMSGE